MTTKIIKPPITPLPASASNNANFRELVIPVIDQGRTRGIGHDDLNDPEQSVILQRNIAPVL